MSMDCLQFCFHLYFLTVYFFNRTYAESEWCLQEFRDAHAHATGNGSKKFLVPILFEDINIKDLDTDLKFYLENHTKIKYKNLVKFFFSLRPKFKCDNMRNT